MNNHTKNKIVEAIGWKKDFPACDEMTEEPILAWRSPEGRGPLGDGYLPDFERDLSDAWKLVKHMENKGFCWSAISDLGLAAFQFTEIASGYSFSFTGSNINDAIIGAFCNANDIGYLQ